MLNAVESVTIGESFALAGVSIYPKQRSGLYEFCGVAEIFAEE